MIKTQVCIIGAGAGGVGCAYSLIKNGINTVVVDRNPDFGGTMVFSGVDGWEPGVTLDGLHIEIKSALEKIPHASHTTEVVPNLNMLDPSVGRDWSRHSLSERPWGYCMPMGCSYEETLGRCTSIRGEKGPFRRFQFDGRYFSEALRSVFSPYE